MAGAIKNFTDLDCWKKCRELRRFVATKVANRLPAEERFRMRDQLLRAARSTTANIAEGFGRFHPLDNAKFCANSRGSCNEVLDHLITAHDEELIPEDLLQAGETLTAEAVRLLSGYIAYLRRSARKN